MTDFTRALKADAYKRRQAHEAVATYLTAAALGYHGFRGIDN